MPPHAAAAWRQAERQLKPLPCPAGAVVWDLPDGVAVLVLRPQAGLVGRVERKAGVLQGTRHFITQPAEFATEAVAAERRRRLWHDLEIHILRHAADKFVRASECRAATKDQGEWCGVNRRDSADGAHDMQIFLHETEAR